MEYCCNYLEEVIYRGEFKVTFDSMWIPKNNKKECSGLIRVGYEVIFYETMSFDEDVSEEEMKDVIMKRIFNSVFVVGVQFSKYQKEQFKSLK